MPNPKTYKTSNLDILTDEINIVAIKGFTSFGRLEKYFHPGIYDDWQGALFFPIKFNWKRGDETKVIEAYNQHLVGNYILIAYSDGGTIAHQIFLLDPNCIGLICVNALFHAPAIVPSNRPVYILQTQRDRTGMQKHSERAAIYYKINEGQVTYRLIEPQTPSLLNHAFKPAIKYINSWLRGVFDLSLPINKPELGTEDRTRKIVYNL